MVSEEHPKTLEWRQIHHKFANLLHTFNLHTQIKMASICLYHVFTWKTNKG